MKQFFPFPYLLVFIIFIFTSSVHADWQPLDQGFNDSTEINALAVDNEGHLYVGGRFSIAGGQPVNNIAKWNGQTWESLGAGVNGTVNALVTDNVGHLYVGGSFTMAGETPVNYIARWDGQQWQALDVGTNAPINKLAIDSKGTLYASGKVLDNSESYLVRWDNYSWQTVDVGTKEHSVLAMDNKDNLYIDGLISSMYSDDVSYLLKWDGIHWEKLRNWASGKVSSNLVIDNTGHPYFAVSHSGLHTSISESVNQWSGSSWVKLGVYISGGQNSQSTISALAIDTTGHLYMGGKFTFPTNYIAQWNPNKNKWEPVGSGMNDSVSVLITDNNGNLYAGGTFTHSDGKITNHIARWDGNQWEALGIGINHSNITLIVDKKNNLYVGGNFTTAQDSYPQYSNVIQWKGDHWQMLGDSATLKGMTGTVSDFAVDTMNNLYIGGYFYPADTAGKTFHSVAKRHETSWENINGWEKFDGLEAVSAIVMDDFYNLYAAGSSTVEGTTTFAIYQWAGDHWIILGIADQEVHALAIDSTGHLYAGGCFYNVNGVSAPAIAQWDGSHWESLGTGMNDCVETLEIDKLGHLYAGGHFTAAGEVAANHIAKWTDHWETLNIGVNAPVLALAVDSANNLYVGGQLTAAGDLAAHYCAKWTGTQWELLGNGTNGVVTTLAVDSLDNVYIGGSFTSVDGLVAYRIARWNHNAPPTATAVSISGSLNLGETVTGQYTYQDAENDPEGAPIFRWYWADDMTCTINNRTVFLTYSSIKNFSLNYLDEHSENKYLCFEVTPIAASGTSRGIPVVAATVTPIKGGFLDPISDQTVKVYEPLTLTVVATHPRNEPLRVFLGRLDYLYLSYATIDRTTGVFEWTPTSAGIFPVSICARETDGANTHCREFKVRVTDSIGFSLAAAINKQGQKELFSTVNFAGSLSVEDQFGTSATVALQQEITVINDINVDLQNIEPQKEIIVTTDFNIDPQQEITVMVDMNPSTEHLGQTADLLFVIAKEPPLESSYSFQRYQGNEDTIYYTVDQHNQQKIVDLYADYVIWMAQFDTPFRPTVTLAPSNQISWRGKLEGPAMYYFFMGYRLTDGTIIYNSRPLTVEII